MATARDIVEDAFRKVGIVASDEPMTADQGATGITSLNRMMHGLELFGINVGWADLALTDEFSLPSRFHEGAVYQLAQRISPDFQVSGVDADAWLRGMQAYYMTPPEVRVSSALTRTSSQRRGASFEA